MTKWIIWVIAAFFFTGVMIECANAATLQGNKASCEQLGSVLIQAGEMRDQGVPWDVAQVQIEGMVKEARANPDSFVQTDEDVKFIMDSFLSLWRQPANPPYVVATKVYATCMGAKNI